MTDADLADQIERWLADDPDHMGLHSLSEAQWRGIAAALRRQPPETLKAAYFEGYEDALKDRQPPSDQALVPREPTTAMLEAMGAHDGYVPREKEVFPYQRYHDYYTAMLAAAEAEGRKS